LLHRVLVLAGKMQHDPTVTPHLRRVRAGRYQL
jgi:hypothetical protein